MVSSMACFYVLLLVVSLHHKRTLMNGLGGLVFGLALLTVFSISTLYHAVGATGSEWKGALQKLDHCVIYIVIAGTYTPIVTSVLIERGKSTVLGMLVLAVEWGSALLGIGTKLLVPIEDIPPFLSYGFYLFMGWALLLFGPTAIRVCPKPVIFWCLWGGISYSTGVAFVVFDSLHFNHAIWHTFVYFGAMTHFIAVLFALTDTHSLPELYDCVKTLVTQARLPKQKLF